MDYCLFLSTVEDDPESAAIRLKTDCDWSHVGFMRLSDNWTFSAMADGKGVAWRPPNPKAKILKLSVGDSISAITSALAWAETQEGRPYDKLDIAGIALDKDWHTPGSFICSTLVAWAFEKINFKLLSSTFIPREHITPRDILLSPFLAELKL